jgi:Uma2 family endonuclease
MVSATSHHPPREQGPAWEIARVFPNQGQWGEGDYLALSRGASRLIELTDGNVEVLEMPTKSHQRIVLYLRDALRTAYEERGQGEVLVAPYPLRLRSEKFREPDVLLVLPENRSKFEEDYAAWADLVMEVVSEDRVRDFATKRKDYAEAGIPEYWIVDPRDRRITVLTLQGREYAVHGEWEAGQRAVSKLLPRFEVEVDSLFQAGERGR